MKTVINNRFTLKIPTDWQDKSIYSFEGPEEDGIRHNIFVSIENDVNILDLERYAESNIQAIEEGLQGYQELKRGPVSLASGNPAYELVYRWSPAENRELYQQAIYVLYDNTGYTLTATFSKKTWKMLGTEVKKILLSFRVS